MLSAKMNVGIIWNKAIDIFKLFLAKDLVAGGQGAERPVIPGLWFREDLNLCQ
jgi:hypothetical protein